MVFEMLCWRQEPKAQTVSCRASWNWLHSSRFCTAAEKGDPTGSRKLCPVKYFKNNPRK